MGQPPVLLSDPETGRQNWRPYGPPHHNNINSRDGLTPAQRSRLQRPEVGVEDPRDWVAANWQSLNRYATRLSTQLRGRGYLLDPDYSISEDPDAVDKMLRDPIINFAVNFRKRLVGGRSWFLECKNEQHLPFVDMFSDLLNRIKGFTQSRYIISEAVFQGVAVARFDGAVEYIKPEGAAKYGEWWFPRRLIPVDKRRLRREYVITQQPDGTQRYSYAWTIYNPEQHAWFVITQPDWFFWFVYNDEEDRLGHGRGLYDALYPSWYAKTMLRQYGLEFAARFAEPWIDIALNAEAGDTDDLVARGEAYIEAVKAMRAGRVLYHDGRDVMELRDVSGSAQGHIQRLIEMQDDGIIRVCLSNTLTTGTGDHGSRAAAEVHENSQENAVNYDRMLLEEAHNEHLLAAMWRYNRRNLFALGYEDVPWDCPLRFKLTKEQKYDVDQQSRVFELALRNGVEVREEDFRERFDLPSPQQGDKVLRAPVMEAGGPPLGFHAQNAAELLAKTPQGQRLSAAAVREQGAGLAARYLARSYGAAPERWLL